MEAKKKKKANKLGCGNFATIVTMLCTHCVRLIEM